MGIPAGTVRVALQGHLSTTERFETGFWLAPITVADNAAAQDLSDTIEEAIIGDSTHLDPIAAILGTTSGYDLLKVYCYNGGATAHAIGETPFVKNGTGGTPGPFQACMVASMRTGLAGRSHRGRAYLPANGQGYGTTGFFGSTTYDDVAEGFAGILQTVNDAVTPGRVVVVSQTLTTYADVTSVIVDNRPDIQRRRANKLATSTRAEYPVTV
jgi:hypothetical protein